MIKMATTTIKSTRIIRKNNKRATKIGSVLNLVKRIVPKPAFKQTKSHTTGLNSTRDRMKVMTDSLRVSLR